MPEDVRAGQSNAAAVEMFELHRTHLRGVAYRMLGTVSEAEDVLQEAFLRWQAVEASTVQEPRAFLTRITTRLCLDVLKSARLRRESYVGTWLPEPIAMPIAEQTASELADDLSLALLMTLERLSPLERAAFLLHDVFDVDYPNVAETLERSEAACRQLVARAREHVRQGRPRFTPSRDGAARVMGVFASALASGDHSALATLLAEDAVLYSDSGGKRKAPGRPIAGRDKIMRFLHGVSTKHGITPLDRVQPSVINGLPGFLLYGPEGVDGIALAIDGEHIAVLYLFRNPDKLRHLLPPDPPS
jgi:RNA polymerase sigma-70 factor (ECF subfamily)